MLSDTPQFDISVEKRIGSRNIRVEFVAESGITVLFGPSGAGKTSILNMVAGISSPDDGHIIVKGLTLFNSKLKVDVPTRERRVGYIFQDGRLFPHKNVRDNLIYGHALRQQVQSFITLDETIGFLEIFDLLSRWPQTLSGGEKQRVAIGRALLSNPNFLLMDEPLTSVDRDRRDQILSLVERLRDELKMPIIYVTHDHSEMERLASTVIEI